MNYFQKINKNLITYSLVITVLVAIFGFNFFISFLGNILLLLFLIPLLLLLLVFIGFNSYKPRIITCDKCGELSINVSDACMNCGANLSDEKYPNQLNKKASERTIEVKAEEIK